MCFRMKVAPVLWELAPMSEHLTAPGSAPAPLASMFPHFGWSACTKAAEVISVLRESMLQQMTAVKRTKFVLCTHPRHADHIHPIHANRTDTTSHRENGQVLTDLQDCIEMVFIKLCIISTWMDQMELLRKVPDTWPGHCQL